MKVIVLGSGTSVGVPMIGCTCPVCKSPDPHDNRTRASVYVETPEVRFLVDPSIDLRAQSLREGLRRIDAVFVTHAHADHVNGLDELRVFNWIQHGPIKLYSKPEILDQIAHRFDYCFKPPFHSRGIPLIELVELDGPREIGGITVTPIPVKHGPLDIVGFRFNDFAYLTDASWIPDSSMELLKGLDLLILNALRREPHPAHFSLGQACEIARILSPRQTYFTHICHDLKHETVNAELPPEIQLAYDGLRIDLEV